MLHINMLNEQGKHLNFQDARRKFVPDSTSCIISLYNEWSTALFRWSKKV